MRRQGPGPHGQPAALRLSDPRTGEVHTAPVSLRVHLSTGVGDALRRALTRPAAHRFTPVVCTDPARGAAEPARRGRGTA
ncbi:hypothetical protein [Blastococcus sp. SYSU DS0541]